MSSRDSTPASVHVLGAVYFGGTDGSIVDLPSVSQRRLLGLLAVHAPRQVRAEWLADVLGVTPGALRTTVSRLRTTIGTVTLRTTSTGYSLDCDVDATRFCAAVQEALTLWTGPVLEEFQGEDWARGETARLTERLRSEVAARALAAAAAAEASEDPLMQFSVNLPSRQVAIESAIPLRQLTP